MYPKAVKDISRLPKNIQIRCKKAIALLEDEPKFGKQLKSEMGDQYSLRVWPYRILYLINSRTKTVIVVRVGHRKEVYR